MAKANIPEEEEGPAIGIDLGTTFSCVAVVRNGKIDIIPNEQGKLTTPSFVAFNEYERKIGDAAKSQLAANAANTIFDAKRLIGRKFNDPIVRKDKKQWPFKVVNVNQMPKLEVTYLNEVKRFSPEEISAMILGKMKEIAESYLNAKVKNAVVTVPAYFNDMQRKATMDAATIAGLNVTHIINEPTAAAIAYGLDIDRNVAKNVLVYDLGGGTFDVSILRIHENIFEVKATDGDPHLGGEDFDNRMMETFAEEFKRKNNLDISSNKKALRRLRTECERAKRTLSSLMETKITIDSLSNGIDFMECVTRLRFEEMCDDLFQLTIKIVRHALTEANLQPKNIDTIVLVGGSSRIPKIQQLLRDLFKDKEICKTINADEAVARGAAIKAAIHHGGASKEMESMKLMEVTPLSLGVAITLRDANEITSHIIRRNTPIPVTRREVYVTNENDQTCVRFPIMQGERHLADDNFQIGELKVDGIPPARAGVQKVSVKFSIDENGILTVTAKSKSNRDVRDTIAIKNVCGSLTKAEIDQMIAEAELYRREDEEMKQYTTARWELEQFCIDFKNKYGARNSSIVGKCDEVFVWLNSCRRPMKAEFLKRKYDLMALVPPPEKVISLDDDDDIAIILPNEQENNVIDIEDD